MPTLPVRMEEDNVKCLGSWLALRELSTSMELEPSGFQRGLRDTHESCTSLHDLMQLSPFSLQILILNGHSQVIELGVAVLVQDNFKVTTEGI